MSGMIPPQLAQNFQETFISIRLTGLALLLLALLTACRPATPPADPTVTPSPTRPLAIPQNQNVDTMMAAQAQLKDFEFGLAPLLQEDTTRIVIENKPEGEVARLAYPLQSPNPTDWPAADSFIIAYATLKYLLQSNQVESVSLGRMNLAAPVEDLQDHVDHVAVWVRFTDGSQAVVDFSPLASAFGALHTPTQMLFTSQEIEGQFEQWRQGVPLNLLQPMKVVRQDSNVYYVLGGVQVTPEEYQFSLQTHLTQTATPIRPLQLTRGALAAVEINRDDFEPLRQLLLKDGPDAFAKHPELLRHAGDTDPALQKVLADNLGLLWHLVTKLEPPPPSPPGTPTPQPTLTPTPTRPALPSETS
jgi:hypothetical protein